MWLEQRIFTSNSMMRPSVASFDLQGHRGARGLKPENTLPAFEVAFDLGATSIETDVHLTRDGVPVLLHDPTISARLCRVLPGSMAPDPASQPLVSTLSLTQLRGYRADRNPDPGRFAHQDATVTPVAQLFAERAGMDAYALPTLSDLFGFAQAYAGELGAAAGKTGMQRQRAGQVQFDVELKRVPFYPQWIGDPFDGRAPGLLEERVVQQVREADMVDRTRVRSFDHRAVWAVRQLEPRLTTAVLIAETAPVAPAQLACQAGALIYCPDFRFLDLAQVHQLQVEGIRVLPWTVNEAADWLRLLDWGVDGITTDYPDQLAALLSKRGIAF
jgi:glycerophosphoryl diester phosphodiesterase